MGRAGAPRLLAATAAAGLAAAAALALTGAGASPAAAGGTTKIVVTGQGSVTATPDRAAFTFAVVTHGQTAAATLAANGAATAKVIAALKGAGVAAADLRTEAVSLSPRTSQDGSTIIGYDASDAVSAIVRDLGKAGAVVDAAVGAGADRVQGPALTAGDQSGLYRKALALAVADAKAKAQVAAGAAGLSLRRVVEIDEGTIGPRPLAGQAAAAPAQTPVEPGTQEVSASVTATFSAS